MSFEIIIAVIAITAYLLGSVSFAIVVSKIRGLKDPRTYGSHNPGATNVLRSGDKVAAAFTLLGDAAKGWVGVVAAQLIAQRFLPQEWFAIAASVAAFTVFLGHLFPVFFKFQGGKGVATALGILLALDPWLGLATAVIWLAMVRLSRISSLGALTAAVAAPLITLWRHDLTIMFWAVLGIAVLLIYRHQQNIAQLLAGKEKRF
jgi:acyl phosphate:glycerol-3-phosphate acyltransferase